ncbi:MAG: 3-isopropylmalate dehydrogenase [Robiginitomaculum sp.]|nr:MAG: 3-isopropylmalate dehydrogenase [Robiginitomaculum sp.]
MSYRIAVLPGDGVGPEVTKAAVSVLSAAARRFNLTLEFEEYEFGGAAIDQYNDPLPPETLAGCQAADAVFLGAVGGPKWDGGGPRPEAGLLGLRKELGLFANLRPVELHPALADFSPLRPERIKGVDILIVRELTGGLYFGEKKREGDTASDLCVYSKTEVTRVARVAFNAARLRRNHVTSIDKANVLETSRLWRETVIEVHGNEFSDVELRHELVDSAAMKLITSPGSYDVVLTENLFGDILSDECSVLTGSIGLLGSASLGAGKNGLFEPIHGSAPDIAGQNVANPVGAIASAAMLLRYALKQDAAAKSIEQAIFTSLEDGARTRDLGGELSCTDMASKIVSLMGS